MRDDLSLQCLNTLQGPFLIDLCLLLQEAEAEYASQQAAAEEAAQREASASLLGEPTVTPGRQTTDFTGFPGTYIN